MSIGGIGSGPSYVPDPETTPPPAEAAPPPLAPPGGSWLNLTTPGGVNLFPTLSPVDYNHQASQSVSVQGESALGGLAEAARRNTSGPEARLSEVIRGAMKDALREIRADEDRAKALPLDSPERRALEDKIDARAARFRNDVAIATLQAAAEIQSKSGGDRGALDRFKAMLPAYLRECVEREGAVIPGVPGSFRPRTDDGVLNGPTGIDYTVKW
jgi:hypothetical protein